jgi:hypothetical protein
MAMSESAEGQREEIGAGKGEQAEAPEVRPLDVYMVLRASIAQLSGVAWQMLGLQADPFTGVVRKDLEQARLAIDAVAFLTERLLPHLQGQEARDHQSLLTDLRLNFVKKSEEAKAEAG